VTTAGDAAAALATKPFVIMAAGVNGHWKIPVGYWFTAAAEAVFLSQLVLETIK
jgi:hypothetical protein